MSCSSDLSDMYWERKYNFTTHPFIMLTRPRVAKENEKLASFKPKQNKIFLLCVNTEIKRSACRPSGHQAGLIQVSEALAARSISIASTLQHKVLVYTIFIAVLV